MKKLFSIAFLAMALLAIASTNETATIFRNQFVKKVRSLLADHYDHTRTEKGYFQMDRSSYEPGEELWFNLFVRDGASLQASQQSDMVNVKLLNGQGKVLQNVRLLLEEGMAPGNFKLDASLPGGSYTIQAETRWMKNSQQTIEKSFFIHKSVLPNLNMKMQFEKKAFGPGDEVIARIDLHELDNQPLGGKIFNYSIKIDGEIVGTSSGTTGSSGRAYIKYPLPKDLTSSDGLLLITIPYQGQQESISRSIPIVLNNIDLAFMPEGGALLAGINQQIAFKATDEFGKPADIEGVVFDGEGNEITTFESYHFGMGSFAMNPDPSKRYTVRVTKPVSIDQTFILPAIQSQGLVIGVENESSNSLKVEIKSPTKIKGNLIATINNKVYFGHEIAVENKVSTHSISTEDMPIGICKLTFFDLDEKVLSERMVFVNKDKQLSVKITTDQEKYLPRQEVTMNVEVKDHNNRPVEGRFSLAVADDKLLTFDDDKQGHILSQMLLQADLAGEIEEPNFYFDPKEEKAEKALDLVMLTHGWSAYGWEEVFEEVKPNMTHLPEKREVMGIVRDWTTNTPIQGARVYLNRLNRMAITNEEGAYHFPNLLINRALRVTVQAMGFDEKNMVINQYGMVPAIPMKPIKSTNKRSVQPSNGSDIFGIIFDDQSGEPLPFCNVILKKDGQFIQGTNTDFDGKFFFKNLPEGEFTLSANYVGYTEMMIQNIEPMKGKSLYFEMGLGGNQVTLESVVVTGHKAPLLKRNQALAAQTITAEEIRAIPGRNVRQAKAKKKRKKATEKAVEVKKFKAPLPPAPAKPVQNTEAVAKNEAKALIEKEVVIFEDQAMADEDVLAKDIPMHANKMNPIPPPPPVIMEVPMDDVEIVAEEEIEEEPEIFDVRGSRNNTSTAYVDGLRVQASYRPFLKSCGHIANVNERATCTMEQIQEEFIARINQKGITLGANAYGNVNLHFNINEKGEMMDFNLQHSLVAKQEQILEVFKEISKEITWIPAQNGKTKIKTNYYVHVPMQANPSKDGVQFQGQTNQFKWVKQFYAPKYGKQQSIKREDFRSTIYWNPTVVTDVNGKAQVKFFTSDAITSFRATLEGFGSDGSIGRLEKKFYSQLPFSMAAKIPNQVITGDRLEIPLTLVNNTNKILSGKFKMDFPEGLEPIGNQISNQSVQANKAMTLFLPFLVKEPFEMEKFTITFDAFGIQDELVVEMEAENRGFPVAGMFSGEGLEFTKEIELFDPVQGSLTASLKAHPNVLSDVMTGLERMLRQPGGCFEQTSSGNYPNVLALDYLKRTNTASPSIEKKANNFLSAGYKRLLTFEIKGGGFDVWGRGPAHEGLTAYGLLQFMDMSKVYPVEKDLLDRTSKFLISRRLGDGGWNHDNKAGHGFTSDPAIGDAYITYAVTMAGQGKEIMREVNKSYDDAVKTEDPYLMALVANTLLELKDPRANDLLTDLVKRQQANGSWTGLQYSVTHSKGKGLAIETTAFAVLALMKANQNQSAIAKGMKFISESKTNYGFGSTQSTVMALKSLLSYASFSMKAPSSGELVLLVNGSEVATKAYEADQKGGIEILGVEEFLSNGKQEITIKLKGAKEPIPFDFEYSYASRIPRSNDQTPLTFTTNLINSDIKMGETVRLSAQIENTTKNELAYPMMVIGIPAGLSVQPWQLKEIQEKGKADFIEIFDGKIAFHFLKLNSEEQKEIHLDLKADIPGNYEAPASRAYLYYTNEMERWTKPEQLKIRS